jgi:hypothetical protein
VFLNYELSPMRVRIEEQRRSFGHLLTRCCAIVGGVFTVMGVIDGLVYRAVETVDRTRRHKRGATGGMIG